LIVTVRFQKARGGEVAILPRKAFEALVARAGEADEERGTARLVARARKDIAGGMPLLTKEVVDRLADGESPVRVLQQWRGITQIKPSRAAGISQGHISDIENRRRAGTSSTLRDIATVLKVPIDPLVA
jgi:hypothetical protein